MNIKHLVAISMVGLLPALSAVAQPASGATTRAEVKAETKAANKAGELSNRGESYTPPVPAASSVAKRADVKTETRRANKAGELDNKGESYGEPKPGAKPPKSNTTRADVKKDLATAKANGTLPAANDTYPNVPASSVPRMSKKKRAAAAAASATN